MRKNRKLTIALLGLLLVLFILQQNSNDFKKIAILHRDYPVYKNASQLVKKADLVFTGKVKSKKNELLDIRDYQNEKDPTTGAEDETELLPYTIYEVEIEELYKGNYDESSIKVKVLGGNMNGTIYEMEDAMPIEIGGEYLFNVSTYEDSEATLLNMTQAIYDLNAPNLISEENSITVSDIIEAAKKYNNET